MLPTLITRFTPQEAGDWLTVRRARRPSGHHARETHREPLYHLPNFELILERIHLDSTDRLLEVGCGGGAFVKRALDSGCTATAIAHSPEMVEVAREVNRSAIEKGRLEVIQADAGSLPVDTGAYPCRVCTGAIGFFPDPLRALGQMDRALADKGRLAVYASTAALCGTPAAPEAIASRARFFHRTGLVQLAERAALSAVVVEESQMETYARRAGLPARSSHSSEDPKLPCS